MRPLMYGYMRLAASDDPDENAAIEVELGRYARREGYELKRLFIEQLGVSDESVFLALVDALKNADVKHVIVPSLWHFARLPGLQAAMKDHIEGELGARLWIVQGAVVQRRGVTS
ncbi:hypothetical protein SZN_16420 [Streptomyces zinciresistens K42]|uniref:Resolvase/invertase-type recombinase catalytic domain-containing protein n=1 Tax=Streptomyces zinciresistens K42 TaxID=700597 RepID=G2GCQ9_9ACTN|nr:recombinase family protein [Streptomyces zinciresistens]EGX58720.1 hypothetical protein SZN_16420 [Streptomyces zinciresistens K42]